MAGGARRKPSRRKEESASARREEESASATAEILGIKNKEEALDLIRAGKEESASATAEILGMGNKEALDLIRAGKEDSTAASAEVLGMKNKEALDLTCAGKEDSAAASASAEIPGMKLESLDLIPAGKRAAEVGSLDLNGKEESAALAATAEAIRVKKKEVLELLRVKRRMHEDLAKRAGTTEGKMNGTEENKHKRKKVVKRMLFPQAAIDLLMAMISRPMDIIPDDVLATYPQFQRDIHVICMAVDKKLLEYNQAIINQYLELGYAVDEIEVTDDEMEN